MTRTEILNAIARQIGARRYVEIGVRNPGDNFDLIQVAEKVGVDPVAARPDILAMTSDAYFASNPEPADLYFIDGLHERYQVWTDIHRALCRLSPRGVVVVHDCLPCSLDAMTETKPNNGRPWNGTVWQSWVELRRMSTMESFCVPNDYGCGVVWWGANTAQYTEGIPAASEYLANFPKYARTAPLAAVLASLEARP